MLTVLRALHTPPLHAQRDPNLPLGGNDVARLFRPGNVLATCYPMPARPMQVNGHFLK